MDQNGRCRGSGARRWEKRWHPAWMYEMCVEMECVLSSRWTDCYLNRRIRDKPQPPGLASIFKFSSSCKSGESLTSSADRSPFFPTTLCTEINGGGAWGRGGWLMSLQGPDSAPTWLSSCRACWKNTQTSNTRHVDVLRLSGRIILMWHLT